MIKAGSTSRILGIDPGTNILGFAVIEVDRDKIDVLEIGVLHLKDKGEHTDKLKEIFLEIQEIIERYLPQELAIEAPFFGKNVQSMLKLGRAQGVAMAAGMTMGLTITEYSPKKVKQSVTGNGNAAKFFQQNFLGVTGNLEGLLHHVGTMVAGFHPDPKVNSTP